MYLRGLEAIQVRSGTTGQVSPVSTVADIEAAIRAGNDIVAPDGHTYGIMAMAGGGYLLDGCPINVLLGDTISAAQSAALEPWRSYLTSKHWTGCLPAPPQVIDSPPPPPPPPPPTQNPQSGGTTQPVVITMTPAPPPMVIAGPDPGITPPPPFNPWLLVLGGIAAYLLGRQR